MSSILGSQGLVLATAMVVSSTVLFLTFSKQKSHFFHQLSEDHHNYQNHDHNSQEKSQKDTTPRSCLYSGDRKKKKKKVQFAENVKEPRGNGKEFRNQQRKIRNCGNEIIDLGMPQNRIALYSGILKDRVHRMECSSC